MRLPVIGGLFNSINVVIGFAKDFDQRLTQWQEVQVRGLAVRLVEEKTREYSVMVAYHKRPRIDRPDVCLFRKESIPWYKGRFQHIRLGFHVVLIRKDIGPVVITRVGDGGYINWAFRGWWARDDRVVTFNPGSLMAERQLCDAAASGNCSVIACFV